jgi:hypothetical protein
MEQTCEGGEGGTTAEGGLFQTTITMSNCMTQCLGLPNGNLTTPANSFCCRMEHCWNAQNTAAGPAVHCPHAAGESLCKND